MLCKWSLTLHRAEGKLVPLERHAGPICSLDLYCMEYVLSHPSLYHTPNGRLAFFDGLPSACLSRRLSWCVPSSAPCTRRGRTFYLDDTLYHLMVDYNDGISGSLL